MRPLVPGYASSFFDVANKPSITAQSLEEFLAHRHPYGNMPYPELNAAQVSDLVSYILSLRNRHWRTDVVYMALTRKDMTMRTVAADRDPVRITSPLRRWPCGSASGGAVG
jgi:hypothetical protein